MELAGTRALVVGASGVLGGRIAGALAAEGVRLAVTARDASGLAGGSGFDLDLLDLDGCAQVVAEAAGTLGGLDLLVVAAGVAAFGPAADVDDVTIEELFAVNTFGPMALCRAALAEMADGGTIAVISAVLADLPTAGMAAYSASKAATAAYLAALRREVRRQKVNVFDIRPPHMDTGLADRALAGTPPAFPRGYDVDAFVALVLTGLREDRRELVLDGREVVLR